ncbi:CBS domain-containing protein [bacterium]|nr:CBS domain-containing protein [bacterium]
MEVIITHVNADFDALASLIAASKLYPKASLVLPGSTEYDVRKFLELFPHSIPLLKPRGINLEEITKLIIVDTRLPNRIGKFKKLLTKKDLEIHIYDHHPSQEKDIKGKVHRVVSLGSTVTILLSLIKKKGLTITPLEASIMALGIYEDTGSLTYLTTTQTDVEMLTYLLKHGANLNLISNFLKQELNKEQVSLLNDLIKKIKKYVINDEEVFIVTVSRKVYPSELATLAHKIMDMEKIKLLFLIVQISKKIYLIARSRLKKVDLNKILSYFEGGGHKSAASATLYELSLREVKRRLIRYLKKEITSEWVATDFLKKKVRTVKTEDPIAKAFQKTKNIKESILPVVDKERNLLGLVSCQDIIGAYEFGLKRSKVSGYTYKNVVMINKKTSLRKIKMFLIDYNISDLPVVENGKLCGLINKERIIDILKKASYEYKDFFQEKTDKDNLKDLMEKKVSYSILSLLKKIGEMANEMNYNAYIAGGFVRDFLLGVENYDLDIVIEGDGINFAYKFASYFKARVNAHQKFNTAVITLPGDFKLDIATTRVEDYEYPAALPKIKKGLIKEDLKRRDFTINAMAIQLNAPYYGNLIDFFGGKRDLDRKKIRILHSLSFIDDPTRIFRAIRLEKRLNFQIEEATENFIRKAIRENLSALLSPQRVKDEIILILNEDKPFKAIKHLEKLQLLSFIHSQIKADHKLNSLLEIINKIRFDFEIVLVSNKLKVWLINFLALIDDLNDYQLNEIIKRFKFTKKETIIIKKTKEIEDKLIDILTTAEEKLLNTYLYHNLTKVTFETIFFILAKIEFLYYKEKSLLAKKRVMSFLANLQNIKPLLNGEDLKKLGVKPGPLYSKIIHSILLEKLEGSLSKKEEEIKYVLDNYVNF